MSHNIISTVNIIIIHLSYIDGICPKKEDFYQTECLVRSLEEIKNLSLASSHDNYGCLHPPLINISLCNIVPDDLLLMLRITDWQTLSTLDERWSKNLI